MMTTTAVFEQMLAELAGGELTELERGLLDDLKSHPEGRTRQELVLARFGYMPNGNSGEMAGNADDRKNRIALGSLREKGFPIVSTAGKAGYRLDTREEAIEEMIAELKSRRDKLTERIYSAETLLVRIRSGAGAVLDLPADLKQLSLMDAIS